MRNFLKLILIFCLILNSCKKDLILDEQPSNHKTESESNRKFTQSNTFTGEEYFRGIFLQEQNEVYQSLEYLHAYSFWHYLDDPSKLKIIDFNNNFLEAISADNESFFSYFKACIESRNSDSIIMGLHAGIDKLLEYTFIKEAYNDSIDLFEADALQAIEISSEFMDNSSFASALSSFGTLNQEDVQVALSFSNRFNLANDHIVNFAIPVVAVLAIAVAWVAGLAFEIAIVAHQYVAVSEYNFWNGAHDSVDFDPVLISQIAENFGSQ